MAEQPSTQQPETWTGVGDGELVDHTAGVVDDTHGMVFGGPIDTAEGVLDGPQS
jgi:hypothetical protein